MPEWQTCPVCYGRGKVPPGFYITAPQFTLGSTADEVCRTCCGRTMVRRPEALDG